MTTEEHDMAEAFVALLKGGREAKHTIDDDQYGAMMLRMLRAWERRVIDNPAMLAQNELIKQRASEIASTAIAVNAARYARSPFLGASMLECARILGIGKASVSERKARGMRILADRLAEAGNGRFSEARRERRALAAAKDHALVFLADYRARRAARKAA